MACLINYFYNLLGLFILYLDVEIILCSFFIYKHIFFLIFWI